MVDVKLVCFYSSLALFGVQGTSLTSHRKPPFLLKGSRAVNTLRGWDQGPVTHVPLPHYVHDKIRGWLGPDLEAMVAGLV